MVLYNDKRQEFKLSPNAFAEPLFSYYPVAMLKQMAFCTT